MAKSEVSWHEHVLNELEVGNGVFKYLLGIHRVWAVKSDTDPMLFYYVLEFMTDEGKWTVCTCDGFRFANNCKHLTRVPL